MNVSLPVVKTTFWPAVRQRLLSREIRLFGIHLAIWLVYDLIQSYVLLYWIPIDPQRAELIPIYKYRNDLWAHARITLVASTIYLLTVHGNYAIFKRLLRRDSFGPIIAFVGIEIFYFFLLSVLVGFYYGYTGLKLENGIVFSVIAFCWLYALLFAGIRAYRNSRRNQRLLYQQKMEAEVAALKAQVNPHFLFNALNNLYGMALSGDSERTAAGIEQLSSVMRHMVEESRRDRTPIRKEIRFLEDTVDLHRMRLPLRDTIRVSSVMEWDEEPTPSGRPAEIAPLLLVSFIENAFKYGISMDQPCFVDIRLTVRHGHVLFRCQNSIISQNRLESSTGTGISNVRQRLALIYPNRHQLAITDQDSVFDVRLAIDL
ncbi:Sensor protein lytS [Fibrisoma limi BUZ 3]|uniref:Sensor protein lytS n=1 Tax=Fibrisoma limi BUZ 3 TaxID=1185876 RepID=I2GK94_9BACT|nr:histidine kinase [Fibrisoma limi]CCH54319.1 Sensor protein lytS [Fibrisoma limi BUZ 3]